MIVQQMYNDFEIMSQIQKKKEFFKSKEKDPESMRHLAKLGYGTPSDICLSVKTVTSTFYRLLEDHEE